MENRKEFNFPSSDGITQIHAIEWGVENPIGVLQIAHGISEYALRYEPFARFLNEHGFRAAASGRTSSPARWTSSRSAHTTSRLRPTAHRLTG